MLYRADAKVLADGYFEIKKKTKETLNAISNCIKNSASQGFYSIAYFVNTSTLSDIEIDFLVKELESYDYDVKVVIDSFGYEVVVKWD